MYCHCCNSLRWALYLMLFFVLGCSALHVDVVPTVDWSNVSDVKIQSPARDPWQLSPVIHNELEKMGFTVLTEENENPDLEVRFFSEEGPDLDANGNMYQRLKSVHIQFVDPVTETFVAVADYFYAENSPNPAEGVKTAFAELLDHIQADATAQSQPVSVTPNPAQTGTKIVLPSQSRRDMTSSDEKLSPAGGSETSVSQELGTATQTTGQSSRTPAPTLDKTDISEIKPKTQSPWIPRFKSWGFENWGKQTDDGY